MHPLPRWLHSAVLALLLTCVGTLLFLSAMERGLNHDEHQFVAPGVLIAREGLLPYRDFPMFHLPNLAFLYAVLDRLIPDPLLAAKLVGVVSSTLMAGLVFLGATPRRHPSPLLPRHLLYAMAAVLLLLSDQLFTYTSGKTWNHELPALLLLLGIVFQVRALETRAYFWFGFSGLCVGFAIGTRLTYLPAAVAFPAFLLLIPLPRQTRLTGAGLWIGACALAMLPSVYCLCASHERFLFDNLQFPRLRLTDVTDTRAQKTTTWWRKIRFFFKEIVPFSLPLIVAFFVPLFRKGWLSAPRFLWALARDPSQASRRLRSASRSTWNHWSWQTSENYGLALTLTVLPLAILGCFLPSRYQYQHYFVFTPLLALAIAFSVRQWNPGVAPARPVILGLATLFAISPINADSSKRPGGVCAYLAVPQMLNPKNWFVSKLRDDYAPIREVHGKILTLAPIGVLEVGGRIYPEFATGPFAWRAASLLTPEKRRATGLLAPDDLSAFLDGEPPAGVLTGVEDEPLEKPFITYAENRGYLPTKITRHRILWSPPSASKSADGQKPPALPR